MQQEPNGAFFIPKLLVTAKRVAGRFNGFLDCKPVQALSHGPRLT